MQDLKYTVIKSKSQYDEYCAVLEQLLEGDLVDSYADEIDLLTLLIESYDEKHNSFDELDPVQLLSSLMQERDVKAKDLVALLGMSKGYISDILHYRKGLSKSVIRELATFFGVSQAAFNRTYQLKTDSQNANSSKAVPVQA